MAEETEVIIATSELEALKARIAELEGQTETPAGVNGLTFKIGEKGGVSVLGLQRFPVTLYADQWEKLTDGAVVGALLDFIDANRDKLPAKPEPKKRMTNAEKASAANNGAGITLSPSEVGMIPGLINKYHGNAEAQAALMTLRDCHELNGKVAFEPYAKFRELIGK